jgi:hypothetical protein
MGISAFDLPDKFLSFGDMFPNHYPQLFSMFVSCNILEGAIAYYYETSDRRPNSAFATEGKRN